MILLALALAAQPVSVRDSFRVGTGDTVLCTAQSLTADPALADMFDRGYALTCRDAAVPVGQLYVLRARGARSGGAAGGDPGRAGDLPARRSGRDRRPRPGRDAELPPQRRRRRLSTSTSSGRAARSTSPRGWAAMTAPCGWR